MLVAFQMGAELGLRPLQALQNIAVINGRPCLWGDAMLALVTGHPEFVDIHEEIGDDRATCTVKRRNRTAVTRSFTMADAKKAGLADKAGPWQQYPRRMLQMRARGFALRDAFPDALRGIVSAEEARDMPPELDITERAEVIQRPAETRAAVVARALAPPEPPAPATMASPEPVASPAPAGAVVERAAESKPTDPGAGSLPPDVTTPTPPVAPPPPPATPPDVLKAALAEIDRATSADAVNDVLDRCRAFTPDARKAAHRRAKTRMAEITGAGRHG